MKDRVLSWVLIEGSPVLWAGCPAMKYPRAKERCQRPWGTARTQPWQGPLHYNVTINRSFWCTRLIYFVVCTESRFWKLANGCCNIKMIKQCNWLLECSITIFLWTAVHETWQVNMECLDSATLTCTRTSSPGNT